jgi:hypothetical protein
MMASRCVSKLCTPPSDTKPNKCSRPWLREACASKSPMTAFLPKEPSCTALSMREMSIMAMRPAPKFRCPTSLLPICPGGKPTSGPLVEMSPEGYLA